MQEASNVISLSLTELLGILGFILTILGAMISQWIWVKTKFAEFSVELLQIKERQNKLDNNLVNFEQKDERENAILSRELTTVTNKIFVKLDEITKITTDIRIKCAAHDATMEVIKKIKPA